MNKAEKSKEKIQSKHANIPQDGFESIQYSNP